MTRPLIVGKPPMPASLVDRKTGQIIRLLHGDYNKLQVVAEAFEHWSDNTDSSKPPPAAVRQYLERFGLQLIPRRIASELYRASVEIRTPKGFVVRPKKPTKRKDIP